MKVAKIEDHLSDKELNELLKENKDSYNIYNVVNLNLNFFFDCY